MASRNKNPTRVQDAKVDQESDLSSSGGSVPGDVFDVRKVRKFIELMNEHDLAEIDLRQGEQRIRLRRGPEMVNVATSPSVAMPANAPQIGGGASSGAAAPKAATSAADDAKAMFIKSPMVGTFYAAASPDSPPFVKVGDQVGPETTVCIIEAMKVFNEIPAECAGKIVAVLTQSGDPVEFGQSLFRVEPNG
jgi:acetyl-CoA carboxylase biotin carboxyl carrier protein